MVNIVPKEAGMKFMAPRITTCYGRAIVTLFLLLGPTSGCDLNGFVLQRWQLVESDQINSQIPGEISGLNFLSPDVNSLFSVFTSFGNG